MNYNQFTREILRLHNVVRTKYGNVSPLTIDTTLNFIAQNYANHLAKKNTGLVHSSQTPDFNIKGLGENLYYFYSSNGRAPNPYEIVKGFVDEVKFYDFKEGKFSAEVGHFTQVVWKDTKKLGFGMSQAADGSWYVCINYTPCGNVLGGFLKNVLPARKRRHRHKKPKTNATTSSTNNVDSSKPNRITSANTKTNISTTITTTRHLIKRDDELTKNISNESSTSNQSSNYAIKFKKDASRSKSKDYRSRIQINNSS